MQETQVIVRRLIQEHSSTGKGTFLSEGSWNTDPETISSSSSQFTLCQDLLRKLRHEQSKDFLEKQVVQDSANHHGLTVRSILGNLPYSETSNFLDQLSEIMSRRVEPEEFMPLTYDEEANQQAMMTDQAAMTLTKPALVAAELYARLLSVPGALSSGLVETAALSSLAAVVSRWRVECCGRESDMVEEEEETPEGENSAPNKKRTNSKRVLRCNERDNTDPFKRSRHGDDDSSRDEADSDEESFEDDFDTSLTAAELIHMGLRVANQASAALLQKEFMTWSYEARDIMIGIVASLLATSSALMEGRRSRVKPAMSSKLLNLGAVDQALKALERCMFDPSASKESFDSDSLTRRHETVVAILRGLEPVILMKEALPKGEKGKIYASAVASEALMRLTREVSHDLLANPGRWPTRTSSAPTASTPKTPTTGTRNGNVRTPMSTGTMILKRGSLRGSVDDAITVLTPPKLKGTPKTRINSSFRASLQICGATNPDKPRPVVVVIVGMLQKLVTSKELENATVRSKVLESIRQTVPLLPPLERSYYLAFVIKLCRGLMTTHRLVGTDLIGSFLTDEWIWGDCDRPRMTPSKDAETADLQPDSIAATIIGTLITGLADKSPTTRTASISSLMKLLRKLSEEPIDTVSQMSFINFMASKAGDISDSLRQRCLQDDKATVRKAAIVALSELYITCARHPEMFLSPYDQELDIFKILNEDSSMLTRKASAEALTNLLECYRQLERNSCEPSSTLCVVEKIWTETALTMSLDIETSCVKKSIEFFDRMVLDAIMLGSDDVSSPISAWRILAAVAAGSSAPGGSNHGMESLQTIMLFKVNSTGWPILPLLKTIRSAADGTLTETVDVVSLAQRSGVWCLFDATVRALVRHPDVARLMRRSNITAGFIFECWEKLIRLFVKDETKRLRTSMRHCLRVFTLLCPHFDGPDVVKMLRGLERQLSSMSLPTDVIGPAISALAAAASQCQVPTTCDVLQGLYDECEEKIAMYLRSTGERGEVLLSRSIFTTGELCLVGFTVGDDKKKSSEAAETNTVKGMYQPPPTKLIEHVQLFLHATLPGEEKAPTSSSIRALAFLTMGKICLRDETLAKKSVNIFARELHENMEGGNPAIQSNALIALGDLCVTYTNLVDRFLPVMAACMQSGVTDMTTVQVLESSSNKSYAVVRSHAIHILSSLLIQDYIKWRGLLFYRFLAAVSDDDDYVANTAETILCGPLLTKEPKLFYTHFVESLFVLNGCTAHPIYKAASGMGDGGSGIAVGFDGINLSGEVGRARRHLMYEMMLSKMSDQEKIEVTAGITKDVLGSALREGNELHRACVVGRKTGSEDPSDSQYESALSVLSDAFSILSNDYIRVDDPSDEEDTTVDGTRVKNQVAAAVKAVLLPKISRKHLMETILPTSISLKALLHKNCSPLLKELMAYIVDIYCSNKAEVKEFLSSDPVLLQEIEYDAKQRRKSVVSDKSRGDPSR